MPVEQGAVQLLRALIVPWRQATALKALRTNLTLIAPVLGLTNLVVDDGGPNFLFLAEMLPLFKALETLSLGCNPEKNKAFCPQLHLDGLQHLRSINLDGLLPGVIRLIKSCKLHITMAGRLASWDRPCRHGLLHCLT